VTEHKIAEGIVTFQLGFSARRQVLQVVSACRWSQLESDSEPLLSRCQTLSSTGHMPIGKNLFHHLTNHSRARVMVTCTNPHIWWDCVTKYETKLKYSQIPSFKPLVLASLWFKNLEIAASVIPASSQRKITKITKKDYWRYYVAYGPLSYFVLES